MLRTTCQLPESGMANEPNQSHARRVENLGPGLETRIPAAGRYARPTKRTHRGASGEQVVAVVRAIVTRRAGGRREDGAEARGEDVEVREVHHAVVREVALRERARRLPEVGGERVEVVEVH